MTVSQIFAPQVPRGFPTWPIQPTLTRAPDMWHKCRGALWTWGEDMFPQELIRPQNRLHLSGGAVFRGGLAGRGVFTDTSGLAVIGHDIDGSIINDPDPYLRQENTEFNAQGGGYIEALVQPFDITPTENAVIWTNSNEPARYSGLNLLMNSISEIQGLIGDNDDTGPADRRNAQSVDVLVQDALSLCQVSFDTATTPANWRLGINGKYSNMGASGTGSGLDYQAQSGTNNRITMGTDGRAFAENFPGLVYGWSYFEGFKPDQEMLNRYHRFWDMFNVQYERRESGVWVEQPHVTALPLTILQF